MTLQFTFWNETMRYPTGWAEDATSQNDLLGPILDNNRVSFQDRLYNLFTNYNNFTEFGNEAWMGPGVSNADSLESIHDAIHSITGSSGHMTYLDFSAFDSLFWLHHAMIDRCFAMWQAIYNDSYVEPMAALEQTFTIKVGQGMDENSRQYIESLAVLQCADQLQHSSHSIPTPTATSGPLLPCAQSKPLGTHTPTLVMAVYQPSRLPSTTFMEAVQAVVGSPSDRPTFIPRSSEK